MYAPVETPGILAIGHMFCVWLAYLLVGNTHEYKLPDVITMESLDSVYFM